MFHVWRLDSLSPDSHPESSEVGGVVAEAVHDVVRGVYFGAAGGVPVLQAVVPEDAGEVMETSTLDQLKWQRQVYLDLHAWTFLNSETFMVSFLSLTLNLVFLHLVWTPSPHVGAPRCAPDPEHWLTRPWWWHGAFGRALMGKSGHSDTRQNPERCWSSSDGCCHLLLVPGRETNNCQKDWTLESAMDLLLFGPSLRNLCRKLTWWESYVNQRISYEPVLDHDLWCAGVQSDSVGHEIARWPWIQQDQRCQRLYWNSNMF